MKGNIEYSAQQLINNLIDKKIITITESDGGYLLSIKNKDTIKYYMHLFLDGDRPAIDIFIIEYTDNIIANLENCGVIKRK